MVISIVIPVYNEEAVIPELINRTVESLQNITKDFEIVLVDDGSTDSTLQLLKDYRENDERIKILQLSRNFGHQAAYTAGMGKAIGNFIGLMDGDLQDPPELFSEMYKILSDDKADVVYGRRTGKTKLKGRSVLSRWFHRGYKNISSLEGIENVGNFSMMNRTALNAMLAFSEKTRYLPGIRRYIGFRQSFVEYEREDRLAGDSKMKLGQLISLSSDAIFSFSKVPIKLCLYLGVIGIVVFFLAGLYTIIAKIAGFAVLGWSSTLLSIYFLGSIQLTFLGVIGEYIYRIHKESQNRPLYLVKDFYS